VARGLPGSAIVLIETFTAQQLDTWRRLKIYRNEVQSVSFEDRSRNNSAVWHHSSACGDAIYVCASRTRKRQGELSAEQRRHHPEKP
jgi:predicted RNA-binding Zn ribbon-like protein